MQFGISLEALWFFLLLFLALLIIFLIICFVIFVGSLLVTAISVFFLLALPAVRQHLIELTEQVTDTEVDSITNWRFLVVCEFVVLSFGVTMLLLGFVLGDFVGTIRPRIPVNDGVFRTSGTIVAGSVVGLLLLGVRYLTGVQWRALAEWVIFLISVTVLTGLAAVYVPPLLLDFLLSLF